jgi:hypothetical protein
MKKFYYLQEFLFYSALTEHRIETEFTINHQLGKCYIGDLEFGVKYPMSYVKNMESLDRTKKIDYCFIGTIPDDDGRQKLLESFRTSNSVVIDSRYGRNLNTKFNYEPTYYQTMSQSRFCLCPIHIGSWYVHDDAWTYRFIEALFCRSIPIAFRDTPIGKNFFRDIFFFWDDQFHHEENYEHNVEVNYQKALKYFTITDQEIERIHSRV